MGGKPHNSLNLIVNLKKEVRSEILSSIFGGDQGRNASGHGFSPRKQFLLSKKT
jgi:hypothetical protein